MTTYEIKDRSGIWKGLLTIIPFILASVYLRSASVGAVVLSMTCGVFVSFAVFYSCMQIKTFSVQGFCIKTVFYTKTFLWSEIEKAGIINIRGVNYIALSSAPITKKSWVQYWLWWMKLENRPGVMFPYDARIYSIITEFYGPLDFNLPNVQPE